MRLVGLPGRSVVPLLLGFGCTVPAVLSTRTLESRRDRLITIMMTPFMSCGARLPVYALFAVAFFPATGQNVVFALYLLGMAAAVFTGLVLRSTLLQGGKPTPFVMELPPYRLPAPRGLLIHSWARLKGFVLGAGKVIVPMVVILSVAGSIMVGNGPSGNQSLLDSTARAVTPAFAPLGIDEDNWPATVGIITGLFAKEAVVGTLDSLYGAAAPDDGRPFSLWRETRAAVDSVGAGLAPLASKITHPLSSFGAVGSRASIEKDQGVSGGTFSALGTHFDGAAGAFAFLVFILLYIPCAAATGAIYRETTVGWTAFAAAWTTGLAFVGSITAYQAATFARHPGSSAGWIAGMLLALGLVVAVMRWIGTSRLRGLRTRPPGVSLEHAP
jgi:ferrous iron transport protein B